MEIEQTIKKTSEMTQLNKIKNIWHIIIGGTIGNITEWYNFLLYGYLSSVISEQFFPLKNKLLSLTLAFTVFALSFFARPVGGILFGWIGDVYGRQRALLLSLIMMAIPTFLIGCLPVYSSIGLASPLLLSVFRILQGLSAGGEHTGSAIYLAEQAPAKQQILWVSIVPSSAAIGVLLSSAAALLLFSIFTQEQLIAWGWRVGYFIGSLFCFISIFLRINLPETPDFQKAQAQSATRSYSLKKLLHQPGNLKKLAIVLGITSSWGIFYQILFVWMPTYLSQVQHFSNDTTLQLNCIYLILFACFIPCAGYLADRTLQTRMLKLACIAMLIVTYPAFMLLSSNKLWHVYIAMAALTLIFSIYLPVAFITMIRLFPVQTRFTLLSFGFNIGLAVFGGTCPLIATWLIAITHNTIAPAFYMLTSAAFSLFASMSALTAKANTANTK